MKGVYKKLLMVLAVVAAQVRCAQGENPQLADQNVHQSVDDKSVARPDLVKLEIHPGHKGQGVQLAITPAQPVVSENQAKALEVVSDLQRMEAEATDWAYVDANVGEQITQAIKNVGRVDEAALTQELRSVEPVDLSAKVAAIQVKSAAEAAAEVEKSEPVFVGQSTDEEFVAAQQAEARRFADMDNLQTLREAEQLGHDELAESLRGKNMQLGSDEYIQAIKAVQASHDEWVQNEDNINAMRSVGGAVASGAAAHQAAGRFGRMRIAVTNSPVYIKAASVLSAGKAKVASALSASKDAMPNNPKTSISIAVAAVISIVGGYKLYQWYSAKPAKKVVKVKVKLKTEEGKHA